MISPKDALCRDAALAERAAWEEHGPAQLAAGALAQEELDRNIAAWAMLAELFDAGGRHPSFDLAAHPLATIVARFARLEAVTAAALARRDIALAAAPPARRPAEANRRDKVALIHTRIARSRAHWQTCLALTQALRPAREQVAA